MEEKIEDIKIGDRFRKDIRGIEELANNIKKIGLIQPIVINENNELIAGHRRIKAFELLGRDKIWTVQANINVKDGEIDENVQREDFNWSERVAIYNAIESYQFQRGRRSESDQPQPRKQAAKRLGVSHDSLSKANQIVKSGDVELIELMNEKEKDGNVNRAYSELQKKKNKEIETPPCPEGKYRTIVIDPPWPMAKILREVRPNQDEMDYTTMSLERIKDETPIQIADENGCHIYLWTTQKFRPDAYELFKAWNVKYECELAWVKNVGITPFSWMYTIEPILFGRIGTLPLLQKGIRLDLQAKVTKHSEKPDVFYEIVKRASPEPRINMFARKEREGFDSWGIEI